MAMPGIPPPLQGPTANEKKFDRQLRLWGANGQRALEESHILLINSRSGVAGVETLKNLVLPSIGAFTIVDPEIVTEADLGVNFFLDQESLGKSRATETCKFLLELNSQVRGHAITEARRPLFLRLKLLTQTGFQSLNPLNQRLRYHSCCCPTKELDCPPPACKARQRALDTPNLYTLHRLPLSFLDTAPTILPHCGDPS